MRTLRQYVSGPLGVCNSRNTIWEPYLFTRVTGGFARSVVNFDAGARTPAAGIYTAAGIALASLLLTPALYFLPQATLAATIIVAVLSLIDIDIFRRTWTYSKTDFVALIATVLATLAAGVEIGLVAGVGVSIVLFLFLGDLRSSVVVVSTLVVTPLVTFIVMNRLGLSANLMSLGGLAIAIGLMVDGSVVVVENAFERLGHKAPTTMQGLSLIHI